MLLQPVFHSTRVFPGAIVSRREFARATSTAEPGAASQQGFVGSVLLPASDARDADAVLSEIRRFLRSGDLACVENSRQVLLLIKNRKHGSAAARMEKLLRRLEARTSRPSRNVVMTVGGGLTARAEGVAAGELERRAVAAAELSASHGDLVPVCFEDSALEGGNSKYSLGLGLQVAVALIAGVAIPLLVYIALARAGLDVTDWVYLFVVASLVMTAALICVESLLGLRRIDPVDPPLDSYPTATAVIAAYLPNEAETILETIEAFLRIEYPSPIQIILAYNAPGPLYVETELFRLARRYPHFRPVRVRNSVSKAQNINAVLPMITGEFVGIFDADHHPDPNSFLRAWAWLHGGQDIVQGRCVIRNGDDSWVSRMIAVEFESIYGVSHPGRARLHGFGIFGGSNGYWRTEVLKQIRLRGSMLTEDIDSSIRALTGGFRIMSDPWLISRELAPVTLRPLWNQRMRWAQGWFQVSMKRLWPALVSRKLTVRQKLGVIYLLGWHEMYPWLSLQVLPILIFWTFFSHRDLDWTIPIFVLTSLFTFSAGPLQVALSWAVACPSIRRNSRWFPFYAVSSIVFFTGMKNLIGRVAQIKEFLGERHWKITPRVQRRVLPQLDREAA